MTKFRLIAPLHEYQKRVARHVLAGKGNGLFLEMGLGKTLTTLEILRHRMHHRKTRKTLILAPRRICEQVWRQEVTHWSLPLSTCYLSGPAAQRLRMIEANQHDIYLMTYENLIWLEDQEIFPFDTVVLDELTKMKNSGSKRWRAFKRILSKHNPWVLGLTGTPAPNGYPDLWAQLYCIDQGKTLGPVKGEFLRKYFNDISRDPTRYHKYVLKPGAKDQIDWLLRKAGVIALRAGDVLGQQRPTVLPSIQVNLPQECRTIYTDLEDELMATMPGGQVVLPEHQATAQLKLRQLSSGFMFDDDGNVHRLHKEKLKALEEYIEEMNGEPLLVVYTFTEELAMIAEHFGSLPFIGGQSSARMVDENIRAWNNRELPVMLVQPQAAGHGLNLQKGGHHILFYSTDWNLETYLQVIARLNRQGQESPVFVRHLVAGEVEERINQVLAGKAGLQDHLMDTLKD
jgi:SNF2 family DNA or RNA helicase